MGINELRSKLGERHDGSWELLATAVGVPASLERTRDALSLEKISEDTYFWEFLKFRVQALAAWNPRELVELARTWPAPHGDLSHKWLLAWQFSLRHLFALNMVQPDDVTAPGLALEADIIWGSLPEESISWSSALSRVREQPMLLHGLTRKLSRLPFVGPYPTLPELLECPPPMLKLLRGRTSYLDQNVRDFITSSGFICLDGELRSMPYVWKSSVRRPDGTFVEVTDPLTYPYRALGNTPLQGNLTDAPPILDLCVEMSAEIRESLADKLIDGISETTDPRLIAPSAYIIATDWRI